jgi:hypothetical protein
MTQVMSGFSVLFGGIPSHRENHTRLDDGDNHLALESRKASYSLFL